jgi:hypothetical protein
VVCSAGANSLLKFIIGASYPGLAACPAPIPVNDKEYRAENLSSFSGRKYRQDIVMDDDINTCSCVLSSGKAMTQWHKPMQANAAAGNKMEEMD